MTLSLRTVGSAVVVATMMVAGCGPAAGTHVSTSATASNSPSASAYASSSASTSPSPTCTINPLPGLCVGRPATAQEEAAMIAVGQPAAERDQPGFQVGNPSRAMVGTKAGTFYGPGPGAGCFVFLYQDASGWHYVNVRCAQATGNIPGPQDLVKVSGCANVRDAPGLNSRVIACLPNGTTVDVDSAPIYVDGHIWWHLAGRGWMVHGNLT